MFVILKNIKKKLLWLWIGFSIPVVLLVLVQTISGKFEGIEGSAWIWVGINLFPVMLLLLFGSIQNINSGKVIYKPVYRIIWTVTFLYLLLVIITQLGMTAGTRNQSILEYFEQSYTWLLPLQIIILLVLGLLYFRKKIIFQPNEKMMKSHFEKKAEKAKKNNNISEQKAYNMLVAEDVEGVFGQLRNDASGQQQDKDRLHESLLLQSRYTKWKKNTEMNLIDRNTAQTEWNQIYYSLVNLIDDLYPDH